MIALTNTHVQKTFFTECVVDVEVFSVIHSFFVLFCNEDDPVMRK